MTSRLQMMQARYQQRQQEEKEHKLFAMLEEQHHVDDINPAGSFNPAKRTNSTSSTASLASSLASSMASSIGSTGNGGKVRQMFEDRRNQINGRPPLQPTYAKNHHVTRRTSPTKGKDRSYPLDPLPVVKSTGDPRRMAVNAQRQAAPSYRSRGASLERGGRGQDRPGAMADPEQDRIRRSKSQFQVDEILTSVARAPEAKPSRSMNSLLVDDNQNDVYDAAPSRTSYRRNEEDAENGNAGMRMRSYRKIPSDFYQTMTKSDQVDSSGRGGGAYPETLAALETARQLQKEKLQIEAAAKEREQQLLQTIRHQQQLLDQLQQAAAIAEKKTQRFVRRETYEEAPPTAPATPPKPKIALKPVPMATKPAPVAAPTKTTSGRATGSGSESGSDTPAISGSRNGGSGSRGGSGSGSGSGSNTKTGSKVSTTRRSIFSTGPAADGLVSCGFCGRNFAADRIEKHEGVCQKTKSKKRKVFDVTKMRVKGTEAESFVLQKPIRNSGHPADSHPAAATRRPTAQSSKSADNQGEGKKADWRKKHESFIEAIRAAKKVQKHLKNGGKISDLPPPPPSDTSDYIQCPHCKRRFSPSAADRHIPKCVNIKSNKPK